ncbi:helix-turn-helix domain-containing protein [Streptosporangium saharense]|uniref:helix-turn-helix domain-containing protein n=1 Tax=Streptosporangium saharense TaxID=1706840 RepID=UPI00343B4CC4
MPVHPSSSVQAVREELATRLRELRTSVVPRLTARALAHACGWHESKVSKIEAGKQSVIDDDIRAWCHACGTEEEADSLVVLNHRLDKSYVEWRRAMAKGLVDLQGSFVPRWEKTRHFKVYEPGVIPGLCQTAGYAEAVLSAVARFYRMSSDPAEAAQARTARNRLLNERGRRFAFLVEETVLRQRIGDSDMAEQLRHLLAVASLPNVYLGVIPFGVPRWLFPVEGFWIYDDEEVLVETVSAQLNITDPREVGLYVRTFETLAGFAVHGNRARESLHAALTALG